MRVVWVRGIFGNIFKILNGDFQTHGQAFQNSSSLAASYVICEYGVKSIILNKTCAVHGCWVVHRLNKILKIFEKKVGSNNFYEINFHCSFLLFSNLTALIN